MINRRRRLIGNVIRNTRHGLTHLSVLTYIYPREPQCLAFDSLHNLLSAEGFVVTERDGNKRATPNWSHLLLSHESSKHLRFKIVVAQNKKTNIDWVAERYPKNGNLPLVRNAKKYIWCQIEIGIATDRELTAGFASFDLVVGIIARESKGVVDLPENEKLYSYSGFSRYMNAKRPPTSNSE